MILRAPRGVTRIAGAKAYAAKLAISPTITTKYTWRHQSTNWDHHHKAYSLSPEFILAISQPFIIKDMFDHPIINYNLFNKCDNFTIYPKTNKSNKNAGIITYLQSFQSTTKVHKGMSDLLILVKKIKRKNHPSTNRYNSKKQWNKVDK